MMSRDTLDAREYRRRYRLAASALDNVTAMAAMARLPTEAPEYRTHGAAVLAGRTRLRAARRIGLLASSMNPLTRAHVALADAACLTARLDALAWVATARTIDKEDVERATLADRLMAARRLARESGDALLLMRDGLYVEQARSARALLPTGVEIMLIVGFDKVVQIFDPHYYDDRDAALRDLFAEAELLVAPRGDESEGDLAALLAQPENHPFAAHVHFCPLAAEYRGDSSSEARALAAHGRPSRRLRALTPPEGLALALASNPYAPSHPPAGDDPGDCYSVRQAYIAARAREPLSGVGALPGIGAVTRWCGEPGPRGDALRRWLREPLPSLGALRLALAGNG